MSVTQYGALNTTALIVPDVYIQIVPPQVVFLNGLPTDIIGVVGTAQWGPVNAPTTISDMAFYARQFGAIQARKYDMGTQVAVAVLQGAKNFRCVRVTDGTDLAAQVVVQTNCITFASKYTGTLGNATTVTIGPGSKNGSYKAIVNMPGVVPEVFDNIVGSGNALWAAMAAAINNGQYGQRGASQMIVATAGAGVEVPAAATVTLAGGTDGATTITGAVLIGQDTIPRKGMYALRQTKASVALLADCDDSTTWANQIAFGLENGMYMMLVGPQGDTISNALSVRNSAGIDSYSYKLLFGDWIYFLDTVSGTTRLVSPQGYAAGRLGNLSPNESTLNKPLYGIVGTQKSMQNLEYSTAELGQLIAAGIDVITMKSPGGNYPSLRVGHNGSSNPVTNGDNYTRMTNYIAFTLDAGMGIYLGKLQSSKPNDRTRENAKGTLDTFFENMKTENPLTGYGMIDDFQGILDKSNNPDSRVALGYMQADYQVKYLGIVEKFLINVEGGTSVNIVRQSTQRAA